MLAMCPPGATIAWHTSKVCGDAHRFDGDIHATIAWHTSKVCGDAHRFDGDIHATIAGQFHHLPDRLAIAAVDQPGRAELPGHFQAVVIDIDHDHFGRGVELRRQQCRQPDRPGPHDRFFIRFLWNMIQTTV